MSREMKHSGIPWIGDIPSHWEVEILKFIFEERNERSVYGAEMLLSLSQYTGVKPKAETDIADSHIAESYEGYKIVREGDFVMNIMLAWNGSYAVSNYDGMISPAYCVFKFRNDKYYKRYYHYVLRTEGYPSAFKTLSRGIMESRLRLYPEQFYTFPTIIPPLSEQKAIADYLDKHCAEVDEMVSLQEKIIEELRAYRQAIITETVTRGLNPNAPMKDSGVEWIGQIPEGWEICKLKRQLTLLNGRAYSDNELLSEGKYKILRVGNLFTNDKWYFSDLELESDKYCVTNDLLYGWSASIGPYIWREEKVIYHYHIWKVLYQPNILHYVYYLLDALTNAKRKDMHGSAMQHLTKDNMDNSLLVFPPLPEQQEIADYLDKKTAEIDQLIAIKQRKIEELKEYKKSLIYEYVTGKKQPIL